MAAKKAPAKKMAAPKAAPKKTSNVGSANAAEKRAMDKKKSYSIANRTDAAGRSGMGETVTSNIRPKKGGTPALKTAIAAGEKAAAKSNLYKDYKMGQAQSLAEAYRAFGESFILNEKSRQRREAPPAPKKKKK
jgi:hypothetical protein